MDSDVRFLHEIQKLFGTVTLETSSYYSKSNEIYLYIIDKPPICFAAKSSNSFEVGNPNRTRIHLIAIDQGLDNFLEDYTGKRPEGILLNKNDLCFIELKLNVVSQNSITQTQRVEEAIEQFDNFIPYLKNRFNELSNNFMRLGFDKYEAYVVLPSSRYPRFSASTAIRKLAFGKRHGIELFETNLKVFQ